MARIPPEARARNERLDKLVYQELRAYCTRDAASAYALAWWVPRNTMWPAGEPVWSKDVKASIARLRRRKGIAIEVIADPRHWEETTYRLLDGPPFIW
ncbi:MAG: hypothetical protein WC998_05920 [Candidatus Paceibacterota bacterium]